MTDRFYAADGAVQDARDPNLLYKAAGRDPDGAQRYVALSLVAQAEKEQADAANALTVARAAKLGAVSARLGAMLAAGLPHSDGRTYPATEKDQQRIAAVQTGIASGQGLPLGRATLGKSHAGGIAELTATEWTTLATAMRDFVTLAVEAARAHAAAVAALETVAEIEAHDETADLPDAAWPANAIDG